MLEKNSNLSQTESVSLESEIDPHFRPLNVVISVLVLLVLIGWWSKWYAQDISIPRYCENPAVTLQLLERVIVEDSPAGDNSRTPYLIAAKLLFLVPRQGNESVAQYLQRIGLYLRMNCR